MRIGINTLFYLPGEVGGSETYLLETLRALLPLGTAHDFVLFTNREAHAALATHVGGAPKVTLHPLDFPATRRPERILREQTQLPLAARRRKIDVLWSPGYTAPLCASCPQVVSILDMQYRNYPEDLTPPARWATDLLVQAAAARAQRLLAISEFSRAEILRHTRARPDRVDVTLLAADPAFADDAPRPADLPAPYLLCAAHTYPHKNVHALVTAFARLQPEIPHHLVLLGKPRLGEPAVQSALRDCDPSRVHRRAGLTRTDLVGLYQGADLLVFPSLYEGFGLPVLEAMTAGTPVLTTRCGAIPEIAGETAFYFDPGEPDDLARQLRLLLADASLRTGRVQAARERASAFSWTRCAEQTLAAIQRACEIPPRPTRSN